MTEKLRIVIIDYGMGNVKSIENAINHVGDFYITVTSDKKAILGADIIILPGVGAFPDAMKRLQEKELVSVLNEAVIMQKKPTLGICLGMQLLFEESEEKKVTRGLGWIPGKVSYMSPGAELRVPHIGWNSLTLQNNSVIFNSLKSDKDFYFVHSLHAVCDDEYVLAKFDYGCFMTAAVQKDNIVGMQFHPEKSQQNGLLVLKQFLTMANSLVGSEHA